MSSSTSHQPRNFTNLPREIRDEIYDFLLGPAQTVMRSQYGWTYNFSTNIFRANRQINQEAAVDHFLRKNEFIIITHRIPGLFYLCQLFDLPIVCHNAAMMGSFPHWSMHVEIRNFGRDANTAPEHMLILAADLEKFCRALRWILSAADLHVEMLTPSMVSRSLERMELSDKDIDRFAMRFTLNNTKVTSSASGRSLLEPFKVCILGGMRIQVVGAFFQVGSQYVTELQQRMGPAEPWLSGLAWSTLLMVIELKCQLHLQFERGDFLSVIQLTSTAIALWKRNPLNQLGPDQMSRSLAEVVARILTILLDCTVIRFAAHVALGDYFAINTILQHDQPSLEKHLRRLHLDLGVSFLPLNQHGEPTQWHSIWCSSILQVLGGKERTAMAQGHPHPSEPFNQIAAYAEDWSGLKLFQDDCFALTTLKMWQDHFGWDDMSMVQAFGFGFIMRWLSVGWFDVSVVWTDEAYVFQVPAGIEGWVDTAARAQYDHNGRLIGN